MVAKKKSVEKEKIIYLVGWYEDVLGLFSSTKHVKEFFAKKKITRQKLLLSQNGGYYISCYKLNSTKALYNWPALEFLKINETFV